MQYLCHGKHQDGLTKNQQRTVRGQAKNYIFDEISKCINYIIFKANTEECMRVCSFNGCLIYSLIAVYFQILKLFYTHAICHWLYGA